VREKCRWLAGCGWWLVNQANKALICYGISRLVCRLRQWQSTSANKIYPASKLLLTHSLFTWTLSVIKHVISYEHIVKRLHTAKKLSNYNF
jgi:hypothetical protein